MKSNGEPWTVPAIWPASTVVLIGGGPSVTPHDLELVRLAHEGDVKVIAINRAYIGAPWADVLYFADGDRRFYGWQATEPAFRDFKGMKVTLDEIVGKRDGIRWLRNYGREGLSDLRDGLMHGSNSGYQAIGLAVHLGARLVLLLGYDMKASPDGKVRHWFDEYPRDTPPDIFENSWLPAYRTLAPAVADRGVAVLNCTPGSALDVFNFGELKSALQF